MSFPCRYRSSVDPRPIWLNLCAAHLSPLLVRREPHPMQLVIGRARRVGARSAVPGGAQCSPYCPGVGTGWRLRPHRLLWHGRQKFALDRQCI
jgi:hypothetical protein